MTVGQASHIVSFDKIAKCLCYANLLFYWGERRLLWQYSLTDVTIRVSTEWLDQQI